MQPLEQTCIRTPWVPLPGPGAGGGTLLLKSLSLGLQPNHLSAMLYLRLFIEDNPQIVAV